MIAGIARDQAQARSAANAIPARTWNSGFDLAHDTYNGILAASDGGVYYVLCSESLREGGRMFCLDPSTGSIRQVGDLTAACGEAGLRSIPQGKSHVKFTEHAGRLYLATHIGYYETVDSMERMGRPPDGYHPYPGGHFLAYDLGTGGFHDLGRAPHGEGILSMTLDAARGLIHGLTWPTGYLLRLDLRNGELSDLGPVSLQGEAGHGSSYRTLCRSLVTDPRDGAVYFTTADGGIHVLEAGAQAARLVVGEDMRKDYFGCYEPSSAGNMGYHWRQAFWHEPEAAIYGVHGNSGYLFRFDPKIPCVELIERLTSNPSRRSGMCDQFSYGYLGLTLGPDGHTLYYLTGGPLYESGQRIRGRERTAKGESKGEENLHVITFDLDSNRYTDHGFLLLEDGTRPSYVNSIAVGPDGTVYTLSRVRRNGQMLADLIEIPAPLIGWQSSIRG